MFNEYTTQTIVHRIYSINLPNNGFYFIHLFFLISLFKPMKFVISTAYITKNSFHWQTSLFFQFNKLFFMFPSRDKLKKKSKNTRLEIPLLCNSSILRAKCNQINFEHEMIRHHQTTASTMQLKSCSMVNMYETV